MSYSGNLIDILLYYIVSNSVYGETELASKCCDAR